MARLFALLLVMWLYPQRLLESAQGAGDGTSNWIANDFIHHHSSSNDSASHSSSDSSGGGGSSDGGGSSGSW